jgi:hypothetical protein
MIGNFILVVLSFEMQLSDDNAEDEIPYLVVEITDHSHYLSPFEKAAILKPIKTNKEDSLIKFNLFDLRIITKEIHAKLEVKNNDRLQSQYRLALSVKLPQS